MKPSAVRIQKIAAVSQLPIGISAASALTPDRRGRRKHRERCHGAGRKEQQLERFEAQQEPLRRHEQKSHQEGNRGCSPVAKSVVVELVPDRRAYDQETEGSQDDGRPAERHEIPALDQRVAGDRDCSREQQREERSEDLGVGVTEVVAKDCSDGDQRGGDEYRRRADPEDPAEPELGHAFAAAFLGFATAFFTMKRSICSRASSSRICSGGDFMR